MQIKKCNKEDIVPAGAFYDRIVVWLDQHINYPKWIYGVYPSEGTVREKTGDGSQYLCWKGGKIIGAFALNTDPMGSYEEGAWSQDLKEGEYLVLHTLAIDPCESGKGYASEVIRFCCKETERRGYKALRVDIVPENLPARRLYEKNGFTYAGEADIKRGFEEIPIFTLFEKNM